MATHNLGKLKIKTSEDGIAFRFGEGKIHRLSLGRKGRNADPDYNEDELMKHMPEKKSILRMTAMFPAAIPVVLPRDRMLTMVTTMISATIMTTATTMTTPTTSMMTVSMTMATAMIMPMKTAIMTMVTAMRAAMMTAISMRMPTPMAMRVMPAKAH